MNFSKELGKHLCQVFTGGNWTGVNLDGVLKDVDWKIAVAKVDNFNTIASLVFHMGYYVGVVLKVMELNILDGHDKFSFDCPEIKNENDWEDLKSGVFSNVEKLSVFIDNFSDENLANVFVLEKYGTYHRNFLGLIEHTHYHLGQIVILKKLILSN